MPRLTTPVVPAGGLAALRQPVLDLGDCTLRPWQDADADAVAAAYADPAIQQWHARSMNRSEAVAWIADWPRRWAAETGAGWAITTGTAALGQISLSRLDLAGGIGVVSYWVTPAARGQHLAPRALTAMSDWAFAELGLNRMELSHSTRNAASCRVAQRAGFPLEGTKRGSARHADGWHDMHLHARLAADPPVTRTGG